MEKLRLLVFIDDDKATNYFHEIVVKDAGICTSYNFFSKPSLALEYFEQLQNDNNPVVPDGIFLDINMPEMDGWEFLDEYAKLNLEKSPVIVMLTTSLRPEDREKAAENQHVHSLVNKPLTSEALLELYNSVLKTTEG